jgi:small-conductance mechanosensitive channel
MWILIQNWKITVWVIGIPLLIGLASHFFVYALIRKFTKKSKNKIDDSLVRYLYRPVLWIIITGIIWLAIDVAIPVDTSNAGESTEISGIRHLLSLILIGLIGWAAVRAISVFQDFITGRFDVTVKDNLQARKIQTQFRVLRRIAIVIIVVIAVATMLMTFDKIKQLGTTILASAGIIGIVIGFAAQKTLGNFIAGLQIAFSQPIRVDDVVIVEGEWGRIEEITLTYVVVKIWDLRRLIVPINYFIDNPFQNWTRVSADILGTVYIYTDYTIPVEEIRKELEKLLKASEYWDGKVCGLQVTNTTDKTVELRALMSAADASIAWNLRCQIREQLIDFVKTKYPQSLPRFRAEMKPPDSQNKTSSRRTSTKVKTK